jgi:hypothetical protein
MVKYKTEEERKAARREKMKEYHKRYYQTHTEKCKKAYADYYQKNKEKVKAKARTYGKEYYEENKDNILEKSRLFYAEHKEEILESRKDYIKKYMEENRDKINRKSQEYKKANKEKVKESAKRYRIEHQEELKKYRECHPKIVEKNRNNRLKNKIEAIQLLGDKCFICGISYNGNNSSIFDFHHKDPKEKENDLSKLFTSPTLSDKAIKELNKCVLLCANCHRLIHHKQINIKIL